MAERRIVDPLMRVRFSLVTLSAVIRAEQKQAFQACQMGSAPIPSALESEEKR